MYEYLTEIAEYHLHIKNNKLPNIDRWGTLQFMVPPSKKTAPNETEKVLFENGIILLFYLKNLCTLFFLTKFYDLRCQKPFED